MSVETMSRLFAVLTLVTFAATAAVIVGVVIRRAQPGASAGVLVDDVARGSLWLAWVVALVTTAGSLYYSLVAHFEPCELCWYQRICAYPLSVVLLVAALRQSYDIWRFVLPQASIGAVIAAYHSQLQAFPKQHSFCSVTVPCTTRYVWEFGFISLPLMDLAALLFVVAMLLLARSMRVAESAAPTRGEP